MEQICINMWKFLFIFRDFSLLPSRIIMFPWNLMTIALVASFLFSEPFQKLAIKGSVILL